MCFSGWRSSMLIEKWWWSQLQCRSCRSFDLPRNNYSLTSSFVKEWASNNCFFFLFCKFSLSLHIWIQQIWSSFFFFLEAYGIYWCRLHLFITGKSGYDVCFLYFWICYSGGLKKKWWDVWKIILTEQLTLFTVIADLLKLDDISKFNRRDNKRDSHFGTADLDSIFCAYHCKFWKFRAQGLMKAKEWVKFLCSSS